MDARRRFEQAARRGDVHQMEAALRAMENVTLLEALQMLDAMSAAGDPRFERWARRWRDRLVVERRLQSDAVAQVDQLLALMPTQHAARPMTLALRGYAHQERNEWWAGDRPRRR